MSCCEQCRGELAALDKDSLYYTEQCRILLSQMVSTLKETIPEAKAEFTAMCSLRFLSNGKDIEEKVAASYKSMVDAHDHHKDLEDLHDQNRIALEKVHDQMLEIRNSPCPMCRMIMGW